MRLPVTHQRSWFVPVRVLLALGAVVAVGAVAIGVAPAAPTAKKFFSAEIAQTAQTTYTFKLTNDTVNTTLGSANVTVPSGFTEVSVPPFASAPAGKTWTSVLKDGVIELRAANTKSTLSVGQSVVATITGTAGCGVHSWPTRVKQSNSFSGDPGNDFVGTTQSDNAETVDVVGRPAAFELATIPSPQVVGNAFAVSVTAKDACGKVAIFYTGGAQLTGLATASDGTPPAYDPLTFADGAGNPTGGVATGSVTAVQSQFLAKLTASNGTASGPSNEFDVVDRYCKPGENSCEASHPKDDTRVIAEVPPPGATTKLSLSGPGRSFTCGGTTYPNIGSQVTVDPDYPEGHPPIEIAIEWSLVGAPSGSRVICMTKDNVTFVVSKCARTPVVPCELSRSRSGDILRATFLIAPNDPGWSLG